MSQQITYALARGLHLREELRQVVRLPRAGEDFLKQAATEGNGYQYKTNGTFPKNLDEATRIMRDSKIANELFGEDFVEAGDFEILVRVGR